ncbi:hypothetical protein [Natronococcus roseus]|uniref:hypothetical protein n=1 Tax=Natronococcus roseus TaxID=1052014 RepID=UPI00374D20CB
MSGETNDRIDLQSLCEVLIEDYQTTYIVVPEQTLANQSPVLLFHVPATTQRLSDLREDIANQLEDVDGIRLGDHELPISLQHVMYSDVHAFRRVPLYVDAQPGMDDVSLGEGIEQARKVVASEIEPDPPRPESIELPTLVEELADAGAAAVELRNESLIELGLIDLRIPITPAKGYPVAGPYETVTFDGHTYDFRFECVLEGPGGYGQMRTPLYVDDSTAGLPATTLEEGVDNLEMVQSIAQQADSRREASERLREAMTQWTPRNR